MNKQIIITNSGGSYEMAPSGNHVAICYSMIEIGTIPVSFQGETKLSKKVRLTWELCDELMEDGRPFSISKEFTASMHEKADLRKKLAGWRGKDFSADEAKSFDITALIGKPCMLNVIHAQGVTDPSRTYAQVSSISAIPKGLKKPTQVNDNYIFTFNPWDQEQFDKLPDYLRAKIVLSEEYKGLNKVSQHINQPVDDLPF